MNSEAAFVAQQWKCFRSSVLILMTCFMMCNFMFLFFIELDYAPFTCNVIVCIEGNEEGAWERTSEIRGNSKIAFEHKLWHNCVCRRKIIRKHELFVMSHELLGQIITSIHVPHERKNFLSCSSRPIADELFHGLSNAEIWHCNTLYMWVTYVWVAILCTGGDERNEGK